MFTLVLQHFEKCKNKLALITDTLPASSLFNPRGNTIGDLSDKAVDKTLNNKVFMKFAENKKRWEYTQNIC